MYVYDTVTAALNGLKSRGFTIDFNLEENCLVCHEERYNIDDFDIVEIYRFEGESDPGDEAVVYGVEGKNGKKGVLVTGYGLSAIGLGAEMAKKLSVLHEEK